MEIEAGVENLKGCGEEKQKMQKGAESTRITRLARDYSIDQLRNLFSLPLEYQEIRVSRERPQRIDLTHKKCFNLPLCPIGIPLVILYDS